MGLTAMGPRLKLLRYVPSGRGRRRERRRRDVERYARSASPPTRRSSGAKRLVDPAQRRNRSCLNCSRPTICNAAATATAAAITNQRRCHASIRFGLAAAPTVSSGDGRIGAAWHSCATAAAGERMARPDVGAPYGGGMAAPMAMPHAIWRCQANCNMGGIGVRGVPVAAARGGGV
jgi:hypothetical protein